MGAHLAFGTFLSKLWRFFKAIGQFYIVVNRQILNKSSGNLVTLTCSEGDKEGQICVLNSISALGSGCGTVDTLVTSNTRGPGFVSGHWQLLLTNYFLLIVCRKDKIKKKRSGMAD